MKQGATSDEYIQVGERGSIISSDFVNSEDIGEAKPRVEYEGIKKIWRGGENKGTGSTTGIVSQPAPVNNPKEKGCL